MDLEETSSRRVEALVDTGVRSHERAFRVPTSVGSVYRAQHYAGQKSEAGVQSTDFSRVVLSSASTTESKGAFRVPKGGVQSTDFSRVVFSWASTTRLKSVL